MRVIAPVGPVLGEPIAAKLKRLFFGVATRRKAIPSEQARFFPEVEAQRRTLGPGLPHHRHPMTADEALAGLMLLGVIAASAFIVGWAWL